MMEHIIIKLRDELGITDMAVLLYFKPDIIKNHFGDGSDLGVNITYVQPDDDYGTAGAVAFAREFLDDTFIIVSGDLVTNFDFKSIEKFHKKKDSKLTITLTRVENPLQFGVVIANEEDRIEKFLEKPSWGEVFSDTINTGIYVIEPEILNYIPHGENFDFAKDLFPTLMKNNIPLWGCSIDGYWRDVGNPVSYREVYQDIFKGEISLPIKGELKELDNGIIYMEEGVKLPEKLRINGTVVLEKNVKISEGVTLTNCCLGTNTKVKKHSEVVDSIIWNDVVIGSKSKIHNSVICNNNIIKDDVKAILGVIMAERCEIGKKVAFERDIIMWPEKIIDANSVISNNVIWGTKYKSSVFENGKVIGRTNIELSVEMSTKLAESFGSILPIGSKVYLSRDYHKSSRMLKRAFLSGLLATGIDIVDLFNAPSNVMRHNLANNEDMSAGIHFRQSVEDPTNTEIVFFTSEGMVIDSKVAKSIERIFFRENFRRVNQQEIGDISEDKGIKGKYIEQVVNKIDKSVFKDSDIKVATDIMYGSTSDIYPQIMNELGIENIVLNAYKDDKSLSKLYENITKSQENMENIVKAMGLGCGFLVYPNGQRLQMIDNNGKLVFDYISLLVVLHLLDVTADEKLKVFLPAWAPDFIEYKNLEITRGKLSNVKADDLKEYALVATTDGHFAFSDFGLNSDAIYASFKILELIQKSKLKISEVIKKLPNFVFRGENVSCPSEYKGKMMRMFLEDGKDKDTDSTDGIKTWINEDEWILMVPDEHSDYLNIYIQAGDHKSAEKIFWKYQDKIENWINE
jgi:mannose-1-phosphate guanylyltransferase/phosphomannomutase